MLEDQKDTLSDSRAVVQAHYDALKKEIAALRAASEPLKRRRAELQAKIQPIEVQMAELQDQIERIERPHLGQLENELARFARALGAKSLQAGPAEAVVR